MRRFCDSAGVPTPAAIKSAREHGVTAWAGYLASPYAYRAWRPSELTDVLREMGALLPIYVGPYPKVNGKPTKQQLAAAVANASPTTDATRLLESLHSIGGRSGPMKQPVAIDIEANVWEASPKGVLYYLSQLIAAVDRQGGHGAVELLPYSSIACLKGTETLRFAHVWCADWLDSTEWPAHVAPPGLGTLWQGHRAWQYHGGTHAYGMTVDLNVADDTFPFIVHHAVTPAHHPARQPAPAKKKTATATIVVDGITYTGHLTEK